jgi:hypothetical protein
MIVPMQRVTILCTEAGPRRPRSAGCRHLGVLHLDIASSRGRRISAARPRPACAEGDEALRLDRRGRRPARCGVTGLPAPRPAAGSPRRSKGSVMALADEAEGTRGGNRRARRRRSGARWAGSANSTPPPRRRCWLRDGTPRSALPCARGARHTTGRTTPAFVRMSLPARTISARWASPSARSSLPDKTVERIPLPDRPLSRHAGQRRAAAGARHVRAINRELAAHGRPRSRGPARANWRERIGDCATSSWPRTSTGQADGIAWLTGYCPSTKRIARAARRGRARCRLGAGRARSRARRRATDPDPPADGFARSGHRRSSRCSASSPATAKPTSASPSTPSSPFSSRCWSAMPAMARVLLAGHAGAARAGSAARPAIAVHR